MIFENVICFFKENHAKVTGVFTPETFRNFKPPQRGGATRSEASRGNFVLARLL